MSNYKVFVLQEFIGRRGREKILRNLNIFARQYFDHLTYEKIGKLFNISRERARQIVGVYYWKLKHIEQKCDWYKVFNKNDFKYFYSDIDNFLSIGEANV